MAKLLVQESNGAREFDLVDMELTIGRELDNSLRLSDPSVSRHHAVIRQGAQGHEIQDLGSSNGVLINGHRVQTALLQDGDRITLGQLQITFVDPAPRPASPLGTVRMTVEDMAKLQSPARPPSPLGTGITAEMQAPALARAQAPLQVPPPAPVPAPGTPAPAVPAPAAPLPPRDKAPVSLPPRIQAPANTAPAFLQPFLPPIPDDAEPVLDGGVPERGDFGTRLLACIIDGALCAVVSLVFSILSKGLLVLGPFAFLLLFVLSGSVGLACQVFLLWCQVTFGATFGKKVMRLRVVPEEDPRGRIGWPAALLRFLGHVISLALLGLPYLLILGSERKGLQDHLSRSIVIKVDR